jgi:hypothetical protein
MTNAKRVNKTFYINIPTYLQSTYVRHHIINGFNHFDPHNDRRYDDPKRTLKVGRNGLPLVGDCNLTQSICPGVVKKYNDMQCAFKFANKTNCTDLLSLLTQIITWEIKYSFFKFILYLKGFRYFFTFNTTLNILWWSIHTFRSKNNLKFKKY